MNKTAPNVLIGSLIFICVALAFVWFARDQSTFAACIRDNPGWPGTCFKGKVEPVVKPVVFPTGFDDSIIKRLVLSEVERREQVTVYSQKVTIISPGLARATFEGGAVDVSYGFRNLLDCSKAEQAKCDKEIQTNPLGFTVISYIARRD